MQLSDLWRQRARDLRTGVSGGIGNEPQWIEANTWMRAALELDQYHGKRKRSRYKMEEKRNGINSR